jgi:hypothetical protein
VRCPKERTGRALPVCYARPTFIAAEAVLAGRDLSGAPVCLMTGWPPGAQRSWRSPQTNHWFDQALHAAVKFLDAFRQLIARNTDLAPRYVDRLPHVLAEPSAEYRPDHLFRVSINHPVFDTAIVCRELKRLMTQAGWPGVPQNLFRCRFVNRTFVTWHLNRPKSAAHRERCRRVGARTLTLGSLPTHPFDPCFGGSA